MTVLEHSVASEALRVMDTLQEYIAEERARKSKELTSVERMAWEYYKTHSSICMREALATAKAFYEICLIER